MSPPDFMDKHDPETFESDFASTSLSLWDNLTKVQVNALNRKCMTLPLLNLRSQYARNFHLAWLGFWVAFLSWFAFSPLIPEAVSKDLELTTAQVGNSNIVSLCATLIVRLICGPCVDRYGPRKVMAALLVIGAIPSGLAGTVKTAQGLYIIRFFIGILGGTFVPCQAWTTAFFDKKVVGTANALVGGWGNSGGGFTFMIMLALYNTLVRDGLSSHSAWRAAFAIVPVPILLVTAAAVMIFGTDHPAGKWSDRFKLPAAHSTSNGDDTPESKSPKGEQENLGRTREADEEKWTINKNEATVVVEGSDTTVAEVNEVPTSSLDTAINKPLTLSTVGDVLTNKLTWLPSLAYLTTFGYELALDANLANVLYKLYKSHTFGQTKAGYVAGIYGLLNVVSRPLGGYFGDIAYRFFGVKGKKYLTLGCGIIQGFLSLALGLYINSREYPSLAVIIVLFTITAVFDEMGNGANFSLVPHCNPNSNGLMSGLVGAMGNVGGIIFAIIFRFQNQTAGRAFWISGVLTIGINAILIPVSVPRQ